MGEEDNLAQFLQPTEFIDSNSPEVIAFANRATEGTTSEKEKAIKLYNAVRDEIPYDPYRVDFAPAAFRASVIIGKGYGFCIPKAIVLTAVARASGIPSRLHFADVRNHLTTERLKKIMKTDLFRYHGYTELMLNGHWLKVTPTFNSSLCKRFRIKPLDFDGEQDAIFHPYDEDGRRHMEYVADHGTFADVPYDRIINSFETNYGGCFQEDEKDDDGAGAFEREAVNEQLT